MGLHLIILSADIKCIIIIMDQRWLRPLGCVITNDAPDIDRFKRIIWVHGSYRFECYIF
jgi:hypothetical protein